MSRFCIILLIGVLLLIALPAHGAAAPLRCSPQQSEVALKSVVADGAKSWDNMHLLFRRYRTCDDGAVAEAFSDAIGKLLAERWAHVANLARLGIADPPFHRFVITHLDASVDDTALIKAGESARHSCPTGMNSLCRDIRLAAGRALPAILRTEITAQGARAVVGRLWNTSDGTPGPAWLAVEEYVAVGLDEWVGIAEQLAPGTDAGTSHGLIIALHHALSRNPRAVLNVLPRLPYGVETVCGDGDDEQPARQAARELRGALLAIDRVSEPQLRPQRDQCRKALTETLMAISNPAPR